MSQLKSMIESILITEIKRLYEMAATPTGLTNEETKKLETFCKILHIFDDLHDTPKKSKPIQASMEELIRLAKTPTDKDVK